MSVWVGVGDNVSVLRVEVGVYIHLVYNTNVLKYYVNVCISLYI